MRIAYFDCFSGASGDMLLGALIAVGWPAADLEATLARLGLADYRVEVTPVVKQEVAAIKVDFVLPPQPAHRRFGELLELLRRSELPDSVKKTSLRVLARLAESEARVHGASEPLEELHLHELGSFDTLFDVVGVVAGLEALGIAELHASPLSLGGGFVQTAHGRMPVPAPAVAELMRGLPVVGGTAADGELLTPTGAALLSTLGVSFGPLPTMTLERIGCGAGEKEGRVPNVVRCWLGEAPAGDTADRIEQLEANVDDMNPELYGYVIDRLLAAGALDVYLTPVIMKKSRPGIVLSVLCPPERSEALAEVIFAETSTLGIRSGTLTRRKLSRTSVAVDTPFGPIHVKVGHREGRAITAAPEFEDCRRAAEQRKVPLRTVYEAARRAFEEQREGSGDG